MRNWYRGSLIAVGVLTLAGCATQPAAVNPAQAVALLQSGQPLLHCREACVASWQRAAPQAAQLDTAARWADLAALVESSDYQDDLSLYYLGRAAEGLGYRGAAASYYRQSTYLSGTAISCRWLSRSCGGVELPRAALLRLTAIEHTLNPPRNPRARAVVPQPVPPPSAPREAVQPVAAEPRYASPAPAAAPAPAPPGVPPPPAYLMPPPAPRPSAQPPSDYIEPPPAVR